VIEEKLLGGHTACEISGVLLSLIDSRPYHACSRAYMAASFACILLSPNCHGGDNFGDIVPLPGGTCILLMCIASLCLFNLRTFCWALLPTCHPWCHCYTVIRCFPPHPTWLYFRNISSISRICILPIYFIPHDDIYIYMWFRFYAKLVDVLVKEAISILGYSVPFTGAHNQCFQLLLWPVDLLVRPVFINSSSYPVSIIVSPSCSCPLCLFLNGTMSCDMLKSDSRS